MEKLTYIQNELFKLHDATYRDFHSALMPNIEKELVIGVRMPQLRKLARQLWKNERTKCMEFMNNLPHKYYEENNLHAVFIQNIKSYEECIFELEKFLPYVDNWATCDMMNPKALKKNITDLEKTAHQWILRNEEYVVRYAIGIFMRYFLEENFKKEYLRTIAKVKSDKYYINMMLAWYFATALAKQYDAAVDYLENNQLDKWVHNKTIQKAIESYRIADEKKAYLRSLKRK